MVSKQAHVPGEVSKTNPSRAEKGSGGPSDTQDNRIRLYSLPVQKSKKVYSPPEKLQGFGDQ